MIGRCCRLWLALGATARAATPELPTEPTRAATTAAAAPTGTLLVGGGVAGGWSGQARGGLVAGARWWAVPRILASASVSQGVAETGCISCTGTLARVSVRANALEQPWLRVGAFGDLTGTIGHGATGAAALGVAAEGGVDRVRLALTLPVVSTVDLLEDGRTGWETGLSLHTGTGHATRLGTAGAHFRPVLAHRYATERWWLTGEAIWDVDGIVARLRGGWRF